ncbi:hypothetical protein VCHENC02_3541A, partial [Vibrio harveyi]
MFTLCNIISFSR